MKTKQILIAITISVVCFLLTSASAYWGHDVKLVTSLLVYSAVPWIVFKRSACRKRNFAWFILILALPILLVLVPIHITSYNQTKISIPSSMAQLFGIGFGALIAISRPAVKIAASILVLVLATWMYFKGYDYWINKINTGSYTGIINEETPQFSFSNPEGSPVSNVNIRNKVVVLDFWTTHCGYCFEKFPIFQEKWDTYKADSNFLFYAVNSPYKSDTAGQALAMIRSENYSFPVLLAPDIEAARKFKVYGYPTTIVIDKSGRIIFRGDIRLMEPVLKDLK